MGADPSFTGLDESTLETVQSCGLCGSTAASELTASQDRLHRLPGTFAVVRCATCGLGRLSPRPSASSLPRYYPSAEYSSHQEGRLGTTDPERRFGRLRDAVRDETLRQHGYPRSAHPWVAPLVRLGGSRFRRRLAYSYRGLPRWVPRGRALDVGCGNGEFLAVLADLGWTVRGVDASSTAAQAAARSFGISVHAGQVTDDVFEPGEFDFIHMSHVIEHVDDPVRTLRRVTELLRPGGILYVETPNLESFGFSVWGTHWVHLDSPRHLWLFTPSTLSRAVRQSGLDIERVSTLARADFAWEATYVWEEKVGTFRSRRPSWDDSSRSGRALLALRSEVRHLLDRTSGDILVCWARRPEANPSVAQAGTPTRA